jgi:pyruvate,orthophosphate dikinase
MNLCCVAGCSDISIDESAHTVTFTTSSGATITKREGDWLSLNGSKGKVLDGKLAVVDPETSGNFAAFLAITDQVRTMDVFANADTPKDAKVALGFGAQGIGLVRTEHMFFARERLVCVQEMILAQDTAAREVALAKLLPFQTADFEGILGCMSGKPVVIRLLDPPLHEFLPHAGDAEAIAGISQTTGVSVDAVTQKIASLQEFNPMLGFRGCRLGVVYPEISRMQVRAIFTASLALLKKGLVPLPHIEIPLAGNVKEYLPLKALVKAVAAETGAEGKVKYHVGTMIEVPRAALTANEFAAEADFMSFGTNDLTQMTCGFSRDDAGSFLKEYVKKGIYSADPFQSIDATGVGKLMEITVQLARGVNPSIDIGICGEHGGEPRSIEVCQRVGLNNISCSPYRVPVARLAAAQAAVRWKNQPRGLPINLQARL